MRLNLINELFYINCIIAYPISDLTLEMWSKLILELEPEITPDVIKWIINKMAIGLIPYDSKIGIPNIFNGFRKYISIKIEQTCKPGMQGNKWTELYKKYNLNKNNIPNAIG